MKFRFSYFLFLALIAADAFAATGFEASIGFENLNFIPNRAQHSKNDQETLDADFNFHFENDRDFKAVLHPRLRVDFIDSRRNRYLPNEAYLVYFTPRHEFTAGFQVRHWGVSHSLNPTDVLNRRDFEDNFYDPEKLGELMVSWKGTAERMGAFGETSFEAIALPFFRETPLPDRDTRFSLDGEAGIIPYTFLNREERLEYPKAMGVAAKFAARLSPVDVSLHYYHGPDRSPAYRLRVGGDGALRLVPFYYVTDTVGLNANAGLGNWNLHFEAAYKNTGANSPIRHEINFEGNDAVPQSRLEYVPGVDYTFNQPLKLPLNLTVVAEYLGETSEQNLRNFRPFKNDLFVGVRCNFENAKETRFELGFIPDLANGELAVLADFSSKVYRELKLNAGAVIVKTGDEEFSPITYFGNNSYVRAGLSWSFGYQTKN